MTNKDAAYPWDIKFVIEDGETDIEYGFMLVTPPEETKQLFIDEVPGPNSNRSRTAEQADYYDFDPAYDTPFVMQTWVGGSGQLAFDLGDPTKHLWSSCVTHTDGIAYLNPDHNSASLANGATLVRGFRKWIDSTGADYYFAFGDDKIWRVGSPAGTWTQVFQAAGGAPVTDIFFYGGACFIAINAFVGPDYYRQDDPTAGGTNDWNVGGSDAVTGVNQTPFDSTVGTPRFFSAVGKTMYAVRGNNTTGIYNEVFFNDDPVNVSTWSGPVVVGDAQYKIQELLAVDNFLFVIKQDAIYSISPDQEVVEVIWRWKGQPSPANFQFTGSHLNKLIYTVGTDAFMYDPITGANTNLGLGTQPSFSLNEIRGVASDNSFVYVLANLEIYKILEGTGGAGGVYLLRGYLIDGVWRWEAIPAGVNGPIASFPAEPTETGVSYVISHLAAGSLFYWEIPGQWNSSALTSGYAPAGELYTSITFDNFPGLNKRRIYLGVVTEQCDDDNEIRVWYSIDNGANFTQLGTINTDGTTLFDFDNVASGSIVLRFQLIGDRSSTPILVGFDLHSRVRYRYLQAGSAAVRVGDDIERRNGAPARLKASDYKAALEALRATDAKITYSDFLGNTFPVSIGRIPYRPSRHEDSKDKYEMEAQISFARAEVGD